MKLLVNQRNWSFFYFLLHGIITIFLINATIICTVNWNTHVVLLAKVIGMKMNPNVSVLFDKTAFMVWMDPELLPMLIIRFVYNSYLLILVVVILYQSSSKCYKNFKQLSECNKRIDQITTKNIEKELES